MTCSTMNPSRRPVCAIACATSSSGRSCASPTPRPSTKLEEDIAAGLITFENPVSWGIDMASEHERYLAEQVYKGPIVVTNYPKDIKAFYMKLDPDEKTVSAMDILVPRPAVARSSAVRRVARRSRLDVLEPRRWS